MKPAVTFFCLLACCGALLGSQTSAGASAGQTGSPLDELVLMSRAGSSDVDLLAYAKAHRGELPSEVSDKDLEWLLDSGVSERVVSYLMAIDARIPDDTAGVSRAASATESTISSYSGSYPESDGGSYDNGYSSGDVASSDAYAYPEDYAGAYAGSYWSDWCPYCYGYPYYPYALFLYPPLFFSHFHDHVDHHDHHGHDGHDGGHRPGKPGGVMTASRGSSEAWRERGSSQVWRERGSAASWRRPSGSGSRAPARTSFARQGISRGPGAVGRRVAPRGLRPPGAPRGGLASGFRAAPQASPGSRGSFGRSSFSSGGARGAVGSPGGRGRR